MESSLGAGRRSGYAVLLVLLVLSGCWIAGRAACPQMSEARSRFEQLVEQKSYDEAMTVLEPVITQCPGTEEAAEACLLLVGLQRSSLHTVLT